MVANRAEGVERRGGPAGYQFGDRGFLRAHGQLSFRVSGTNAQAVVERAIEGRGIAQESRLGSIDVMHAFEDFDAFGRIQRLKEYARAFEAQVHQQKIDVVISTTAGL